MNIDGAPRIVVKADEPKELLAFAVMTASPGGTVVVPDEEWRQLGELTQRRTGRNDLTFEVQG